MTLWGEWARAVLMGVGAPINLTNITSLWNWSNKESGPNTVRWMNPLNSTLWEPGALPMNTLSEGLHVWSYPTIAEGIDATVKVLLQSPPFDYTQILANLRGSIPHHQWTNATIDLDRWGTGTNWLNWELIPPAEDVKDLPEGAIMTRDDFRALFRVACVAVRGGEPEESLLDNFTNNYTGANAEALITQLIDDPTVSVPYMQRRSAVIAAGPASLIKHHHETGDALP